MYVARDKDNTLSLFLNKPIRMDNCWSALSEDSDKWFDLLNNNMFPEVTWETEPKEVFLNIGYDTISQLNHVWAMLKCTQDELTKVSEALMYYKTKVESINRIINEP